MMNTTANLLQELCFRPDHKVINLLADKSLTQIANWIGSTALLAHVVPLPFIAQHIGPIVVYSYSDEFIRLMSRLSKLLINEPKRD